MKKATHPEDQSRPRKADSITATPSKIARILAHLLTITSTRPSAFSISASRMLTKDNARARSRLSQLRA